MEVKLVVLVGEHKGRTIPLPETIVMIGRAPECHIRPRCQWVSRRHCALAVWAGKVRLRDLKSHNGTFLNGQQIEAETPIKDGDQLRVGTMVFGVQVHAEPGDLTVPPVNERDVAWLIGASEKPEERTPAHQTKSSSDYDFTDDQLLWEGAGAAADQKTLSAGEYFHKYLESRAGESGGQTTPQP